MLAKHWPDSESLCRAVKADAGPCCLLAFSAGKDAVCSWLRLRDMGFECVPYYLYVVPDLEFVEEGLTYYEAFFDTKILRLPHPSLPRMLRGLVFQPPERAAIIEKIR